MRAIHFAEIFATIFGINSRNLLALYLVLQALIKRQPRTDGDPSDRVVDLDFSNHLHGAVVPGSTYQAEGEEATAIVTLRPD